MVRRTRHAPESAHALSLSLAHRTARPPTGAAVLTGDPSAPPLPTITVSTTEPPPAWTRRLGRLQPVYHAVQLWLDADGLRMSAAMSFYGILSLAPLLVAVVAVVGWWVDRSVVESQLIGQIGQVIGASGAQTVRQALASARQPTEGAVASLIAFVLLLSGATGVFAELQSALERLWTHGRGVVLRSDWRYTASLRLRGVVYILAFGLLLLASLAVSTALQVLTGWAGAWAEAKTTARVVNEVVVFGFCLALFVGLMRLSAGPKPRLRYLVAGAAVGALLFSVGKHLLAVYLATAATVSAYGAAGSLVVLLMWLYFSSAVLLFAAGCARAFGDADRSGDAKSAAPITVEK